MRSLRPASSSPLRLWKARPVTQRSSTCGSKLSVLGDYEFPTIESAKGATRVNVNSETRTWIDSETSGT